MCLLQGVRPESFAKLESKDIKDIIDGCTKTRKEERYVTTLKLYSIRKMLITQAKSEEYYCF